MIKIFNTEEELAQAIASEMNMQLEDVTAPVFCLASGSTPAKSYKRFTEIASHHEGMKKLTFVSLDEWVGVPRTTVGSCYQMLEEDLFSQLSLDENQIIFFDTVQTDLTKECERIDSFIEQHPITFSLMGVGMNGHIGLNEPGTPVKNYSSVMPLADKTKEVANKYFNESVVIEEGITLGLQQIINSKRVIVVITGAHKQAIVKEIVENLDADLPAQKLLGYKHIDFYFDQEAANLLSQDCLEVLRK